jgi:hypothetical protein
MALRLSSVTLVAGQRVGQADFSASGNKRMNCRRFGDKARVCQGLQIYSAKAKWYYSQPPGSQGRGVKVEIMAWSKEIGEELKAHHPAFAVLGSPLRRYEGTT